MNDSLSELVKRYEEMLDKQESFFFDLHEFIDIAQYYEMQGELDGAIKVLDYALVIYPSNVDLISKYALYVYWKGDIEKAYEMVAGIPMVTDFAMKTKADIFLAKGDKDEAREMIFKIINDPKMDMVDCLEAVDILSEHELYDDALHALDILLKRFGHRDEILEEVFFINNELDRPEVNIEMLDKLLDKDPYNVDNWCKLARSYGAVKKLDKALDSCEFALAIDPEHDFASNLKAFFLYEAKNFDAALELFLQLYEKDPQNFTVILGLGDSYWAKQDYTNALKYLRLAIELNDVIAEVRYMASYCAFQLDMYQEALDLLIPVAEMPEGNDMRYKMLTMDLKLAQNTPIADIYQELVEIVSETPEVPNQYWLIKAYCDEYLKDYDKAAFAYLKTYELKFMPKLTLYRIFLTCNDMHNQGIIVMSDDFINYMNDNQTQMEEAAYELLLMPEQFDPSEALEKECIDQLNSYLKNYEPKH